MQGKNIQMFPSSNQLKRLKIALSVFCVQTVQEPVRGPLPVFSEQYKVGSSSFL